MELKRYTPGMVEDMALLAWWLHLGETGDLDKCFNRSANALSQFVRIFDSPTELWYVSDETGWFAASWITPFMDGASWSIWARDDRRRTHWAKDFVHAILREAFSRYPVLMYVTRDASVVRQSIPFGFQPVGIIPYLFDGEAATLGVATAFDYEAACQPKEHSNGRQNAINGSGE